jgi:phosphohistidine phosphatase
LKVSLMRRLLLLRHAKAAPATAGHDFERALVERGRRDAARVGAAIAAAELIPDLVLHSGATRTRQTAEIALALWPRIVATRAEPGLYDASPAGLLTIVAALPDAAPSVMLVGHNPSIGDVANLLAGRGDERARLRMAAEFPTAALAVLEFSVDRWRDVAPGTGALMRFVTPDEG